MCVLYVQGAGVDDSAILIDENDETLEPKIFAQVSKWRNAVAQGESRAPYKIMKNDNCEYYQPCLVFFKRKPHIVGFFLNEKDEVGRDMSAIFYWNAEEGDFNWACKTIKKLLNKHSLSVKANGLDTIEKGRCSYRSSCIVFLIVALFAACFSILKIRR